MRSGTQEQQTPPALSNDDVNFTTALGTSYIGREGRVEKVLAIKKPIRAAFFNQRPQLKSLLLRHPVSPILEEGSMEDSWHRDRDGEFFITPEGVAMLLEKTLFEDDQDHTKYNTDNILFFNNDQGKLYLYLKNLMLKNGEDVKILFIDHAHAIPFYIRNVDGKIKVFLIDSQATSHGYWPHLAMNTIQNAMPDAKLTVSSSHLQKDAYSCFTFGFLALKFFAKHGNIVFPYIDECNIKSDRRMGWDILAAEQLMPPLIKLNQTDINLSDEALNCIVSRKKKLTLRDYLQMHTVIDHDKKLNTAALLKKYKLFDKLNSYVTNHTNEAINPDGNTPLPAELEKTLTKFIR